MAERPDSECYTADSYDPRRESCYTADSFDPNDSGANAGHGNQRPSVENRLIALRLTRARLWVVCELLSDLHGNKLIPDGQTSPLDKNWKNARLGEVQTPFNAMIIELDRTADAYMVQSYQAISGDTKKAWTQDSERLTQAIREAVRSKAESTPTCALRDRVIAVRLIRTMLLVNGELCGDLGQDFKIPEAYKGENSLLNRNAEISQHNRGTNTELTIDFKENLKKMQDHMVSKVHDLHVEERDRYDQRVGDKSVAEWCDADAEEIEQTILVPFADECNSWDIAASHYLCEETIQIGYLGQVGSRAAK